jgi:hypothetical protein
VPSIVPTLACTHNKAVATSPRRRLPRMAEGAYRTLASVEAYLPGVVASQKYSKAQRRT